MDYRYIWYVCAHNGGRSQIAEAYTNYILTQSRIFPNVAKRYRAISSGTRFEEGSTINPIVKELMEARGIQMGPGVFYPKALDADLVREAGEDIDYMIIACDDTCPIPAFAPNAEQLRWSLPDPHGKGRDVVAKVVALTIAEVDRFLFDLETKLLEN